MLGITRYLACHGIAMETIRGYLRPLAPGDGLLLVGSVAEGLANPESDLDLLLIAADGHANRREACADILQTMSEGFDLNIEVVTHARVEALCRSFQNGLDAVRQARAADAPRALAFTGADELRLLHRLRTGIPVIEPPGSMEQLRDRYALHALPDLCLLQHVACHLRLRADAVQNALDAGDPHTPLLMSQLAGQHLIAAVLASAGETNPNPKWLLRLLRDHRRALHAFDLERLIALALPGAACAARAMVDELLSVSDATLARLAADAVQAGSPVAGALADLLPQRARPPSVELLECAP